MKYQPVPNRAIMFLWQWIAGHIEENIRMTDAVQQACNELRSRVGEFDLGDVCSDSAAGVLRAALSFAGAVFNEAGISNERAFVRAEYLRGVRELLVQLGVDSDKAKAATRLQESPVDIAEALASETASLPIEGDRWFYEDTLAAILCRAGSDTPHQAKEAHARLHLLGWARSKHRVQPAGDDETTVIVVWRPEQHLFNGPTGAQLDATARSVRGYKNASARWHDASSRLREIKSPTSTQKKNEAQSEWRRLEEQLPGILQELREAEARWLALADLSTVRYIELPYYTTRMREMIDSLGQVV